MQRVFGEAPATSRRRINSQLFIATSQKFLCVVGSLAPMHLLPRGGKSAVSTDDKGGLDEKRFTRLIVDEADPSRLLIKSDALFAEMNLNVRKRFGVIHEGNVQVLTHDRVNHFFFILSVRLKFDWSSEFMDHAAFDSDGEVEYLPEYAHFVESVESALCKRHIY